MALNINTFAEARARVEEVRKIKTDPSGKEGATRFWVSPADDLGPDDLVIMVSKDGGAVTDEVYFDVRQEILQMHEVSDRP